MTSAYIIYDLCENYIGDIRAMSLQSLPALWPKFNHGTLIDTLLRHFDDGGHPVHGSRAQKKKNHPVRLAAIQAAAVVQATSMSARVKIIEALLQFLARHQTDVVCLQTALGALEECVQLVPESLRCKTANRLAGIFFAGNNNNNNNNNWGHDLNSSSEVRASALRCLVRLGLDGDLALLERLAPHFQTTSIRLRKALVETIA
ncbi:unnamed protein product, partial [Polarella glacialis]